MAFLIITTGANITWLVMMFINFSSLDTGNLVVLIITAVAYVFIQILPCFGLRNDASVFTSSLVSLYMIWLQWAALSSSPDATVNPYAGSGGNATTRLVVSLIICFIAIFTYAALVEDDTPPAGVAEAALETDDHYKKAINDEMAPKEKPADGEMARPTATVAEGGG